MTDRNFYAQEGPCHHRSCDHWVTATFQRPARRAPVRPTLTKRSHPDLTGFLAGCVTLLLALFIITAAGTHIQDRAAQTVVQGLAMRGM